MSSIFNQEALDALDDHSEAEEMARVASPKLKIVIIAMVTMMVVALYWCFFGTVNYKVTAQGVVFPFGEATPVSVPYDGTVSRTLVANGTAVTSGTAIVEIHNALSTSSALAPRDGVVISSLLPGTRFKAGEPVGWLLPQAQQMAGREVLCYVTYNDLRKLKTGQQVQVTPADLKRETWGYAYGHIVGIEQYPTSREGIVSRVKLVPLASFVPGGQALYEVRITLDEHNGSLQWSRSKSRDVKVGNGTLCNIQIITEKKSVWRVLVGTVDNISESIMGN